MTFGLKNASATFQPVMDVLLSTVKCQYAFVYLDDIGIVSKTSKDHIEQKHRYFVF